TRAFFLRLSGAKRGHLATPDIHGSVDIIVMSLPDLKTISEPHHIEVSPQIVAAGAGWGKDITVPEFSERDQQYTSQSKTIKISGLFTFDNGYGKKIVYPICSLYIGKYSVRNEDGRCCNECSFALRKFRI